MRRWCFNDNHRIDSTHVILDEAPWWVFWLGDAVCWIGYYMPRWKVPFIGKLKVVDEGETCTLEEWCGDTLFDLFHIYICSPVYLWTLRRTKSTWVEVNREQHKGLFDARDKARAKEGWT